METTLHLNEKLSLRKSGQSPLKILFLQVCTDHHVLPEWIGGPDRSLRAVRIRNEFYYRALVETDWPIPVIGRFLGVHHSTVMYGACRHALERELPLPRGGYETVLRRIRSLKCGQRG